MNEIEYTFTGGRVQDSTIKWVVYPILAGFLLPYGSLLAFSFSNNPEFQRFFDWFMSSFRLDQSALVGQFWRFFTYLFLHAGLIHVGFNLVALFGLYLMANAQFPRFTWLLVFVLAGVLGGLAEIILNPDIPGVVGASAGVFGLWGAALAAAWRYSRISFDERPLGNKENLDSLTKWLIINFFIGLAVPSLAKFAHAGGLIVGLFMGMLLPIRGQPRLLANRAGLFVLADAKILRSVSQGRSPVWSGPVYYSWVKLLATSEFDANKDFLVAEYDQFDALARRRVRYVVLAGTTPASFDRLTEVATPLKVSVPAAMLSDQP